MPIDEWMRCPGCGSENTEWRVSNGYLYIDCEECLRGTSKLVGKHKFRR